MKIFKLLSITCLCLVVAVTTGNTMAAGLLTPVNSHLTELEIKNHHVNVIIEDGYAITNVEQTFHNPNQQNLEAIYSFPVPKSGAVAEFTIWIDGKPVTGEVLEKKQARQIYEEEKAAGRDAGLTEKDEYRTFEVYVTPIRAGQDTRIHFVYLQPAHVDTGMGRYVYPLEEGGVDEEKLAFWTANDKVKENFSFNLKIKSSYPIAAVRVPNQPQSVTSQNNPGEWDVQLGALAQNNLEEGMQNTQPAQTAAFSLDKDLVVYWRHQDGLPGSVDLVAYKEDNAKRGTFMLTVTPGDDLKPIHKGKDWIFVLDVSGSMSGKYATLADGVQRTLKKMRPDDRFRIVLFNSSVSELTNGYVAATPEMVSHYSNAIAQVTPGSGTNLYAGLQEGLDVIDADRTSAIVLVTDGVANVGETHQRKFIELLKKKDIRLFTFVMGNSANQPLLQALTRASNGFAISISNSDDIVGKILEASNKVSHESLHGVELKIKGIKTADITPKTVGSLYRGQQLIVFGHYWDDGIAQVELTGKISGEEKTYSTQFSFPNIATDNPEIERLWAYASIEQMMEEINDFGEEADLKQAVTDLGIEYSLVTDYTSMVVMRDEVFTSRGIERKNQQRLSIEHAAQQLRGSQVATSHRVDNQQPMFSNTRPSYSGNGGGAFDGISLLILLSLAAMLIYSKSEKG